MIAVVDYGLGNLGSILNMLKKIGCPAMLAREAGQVRDAARIILPGVGAFDHGMTSLRQSGLLPTLERKVLEDHTPVLGICLGAQMLGLQSEEGKEPGLGWIPVDVVRFPNRQGLKVPNMGWNTVAPVRWTSIFRQAADEIRFYFVHSYYLRCRDPGHVLATSAYGQEFAAAIQRDHIVGVQFHPEKSHRFGAAVLKNFAEFAP
jgi:glutamine amidotransferase